MVTLPDLIRLPYSPDLTRGGITCACQAFTRSSQHTGAWPIERLRNTVAAIAVELALRRHLNEQDVPFQVLEADPFSDLARHDLSLGGHRCRLIGIHILSRRQIRRLRADPGCLSEFPALLPLDQFAADEHRQDDLYLFAYLLGVLAASPGDMTRAAAAGQPLYLFHKLPDEWRRPKGWAPLEPLALKSEGAKPLVVGIGGMDAARNFLTYTLELPPGRRISVHKGFHSLAYIHARSRPAARVGLHVPLHGKACILPPQSWGNLWIYGLEIWLAGWLTGEEFHRRSAVLPAGQNKVQALYPVGRNLAVPAGELKPCQILFQKVKDTQT